MVDSAILFGTDGYSLISEKGPPGTGSLPESFGIQFLKIQNRVLK